MDEHEPDALAHRGPLILGLGVVVMLLGAASTMLCPPAGVVVVAMGVGTIWMAYSALPHSKDPALPIVGLATAALGIMFGLGSIAFTLLMTLYILSIALIVLTL